MRRRRASGQDPTFALGVRRDETLLTQTLMHERRQFNVELPLSIVRWLSLDGQELPVEADPKTGRRAARIEGWRPMEQAECQRY